MPFNRFRTLRRARVDTVLGPEMRSTGEVMGFDADFGARSPRPRPRRSGRCRPAAGCSCRLPASRSPRTYAALREALLARPALRDRLELRFIGPVAESVRREIESAGLLPYCRFEPFLPHGAALGALRDSAALAPLSEIEDGGAPGHRARQALRVHGGPPARPRRGPPRERGGAPPRSVVRLGAGSAGRRRGRSRAHPSDRRGVRRREARGIAVASLVSRPARTRSPLGGDVGGRLRGEEGRSGAARGEADLGAREKHPPTGELKQALRAAKAEAPRATGGGAGTGGVVSIVVPVHDEAENLPLAHAEIEAALAALRGSTRRSCTWTTGAATRRRARSRRSSRDARVSVVTLRRRFGKSAALEAGFRRTSGARIVTIDGDLQYDAADLSRLVARLGPDCDMAIGWRRARALPIGKKVLNAIFNAACRRAARQDIHDFNCALKAFRREVADEIEIYGELHRYFPVFASWRGFRLAEVEVASRARRFGKSKFGASRIVKAFFDFMAVGMLTRFSKSPLHVFGLLGVLLTALGFLVNGYLSLLWCFGSPIGSRPLLLFGVLLMIIGIQTTFFGLLAELIVNARRGDGDTPSTACSRTDRPGRRTAARETRAGTATGTERRNERSMPESNDAARRFTLPHALVALGIVLAFLVYANTLGCGFAFDDLKFIVPNESIRSLSNFTTFLDMTEGGGGYRPLRNLVNALNYAACGLEPFGWHLVNVLLHVAATALVWRVARRILGAGTLAAAAATILFAVHPIHTEAVANVSGRKDILATIFFLLGSPSPRHEKRRANASSSPSSRASFSGSSRRRWRSRSPSCSSCTTSRSGPTTRRR